MTPEKALKILDETVVGNLELKIVLSNALERQIPKRANEIEYPWAICSVCGGSINLENIIEYLHNKEHSHCEHCGQSIDWGGTE